ncbi:MAG TPA: hypothetical protein VIM65_21675 [Cyclobacteriaceae bacterium]
MNLDKIYSLRENFSVIGLTGRTGAGCSKTASCLSKEFKELGIRKPEEFTLQTDFSRKYKICYDFAASNWKRHIVINYKDVVLLLLIGHGKRAILTELNFKFKDHSLEVGKIVDKIFIKNEHLITRIITLGPINCDLSAPKKLKELGKIFFNDGFIEMANEFYSALNGINVLYRLQFLHRIANNLRAFGMPISKDELPEKNYVGYDISNIYTVSEAINRLIKGLKLIQGEVHVVIDSLKNSLELLFFKERYSAFYMVALNSEDRLTNIRTSISNLVDTGLDDLIYEIGSMDDHEYEVNDFKKGEFFSPDIQNCIQKSDIHLNTDPIDDEELKNNVNRFKNLDEYLIKYASLIRHPGLVTPTAYERCMQVAYNAKYNSGCISRQVGAVVTEENFSIKAVGWNDVPRGSVSCLQRNVLDYTMESGPSDVFAYSDYERQGRSENSKGKIFREEFIKIYKTGYTKAQLGGRNCPFCFKSAYNSFEGNENQVHTRSLHAEENAMLQIAKDGGSALHGGNLFTTASPCELCSKKAFQLGIKNIYYIDPYPGIANNHILKTGDSKHHPSLHLFSGAVGRAYHKLYEPFMAYKDELALITGVRPEISLDKKMEALTKTSGIDVDVREELKKLSKEGKMDVNVVNQILKAGLKEIK